MKNWKEKMLKMKNIEKKNTNKEIHNHNSLLQCSPFNNSLESLYIFLGLGDLHPTQGMSRKEEKLTKNNV